MRMTRWAWLTAAVLCGSTLSGCAGPDLNVAASGPTAVPADGDLGSRCDDILGDAAPDDIAAVAMARDDAYLVVGFAFAAGDLPAGEVFLTVEARSRDGRTARQLGIELDDGRAVAAYVSTSPTAEARRLDDAVHVADGEVHAAFPLAYVRDLGTGWSWHAMAGTGATPDDYCPGGAGTTSQDVASVVVG